MAGVQNHRRWPMAFFIQPIRNPTPILFFVRLFRVDRTDQTQSQQAGGSSACVQR